MTLAARLGDRHSCKYPGHVGGPILSGEETVLIGGLPAACAGDLAECEGPPDVIAEGERTVEIGGRAAARLGDATFGGRIGGGLATVTIGAHPLKRALREAAARGDALVAKRARR
jgi:uncharacterized Zn-binding protein involved in type VI secretion